MWDWRYPIGDIRKEIRAARSKGDSHISLDSIDNLLDDLTSIYNRLEAEDATSPEREADQLKKFVEDQKSVISTSYEHGKQYANIVIFGGYAGLFAVWNFTKNSLENWQVLLIGLFTLISLLSYISFEIYASWLRSIQVKNQLKELEKAEKLHQFPADYGKSEMDRVHRFLKAWPYFFFTSVGAALLAAFILIYSFVAGLVLEIY